MYTSHHDSMLGLLGNALAVEMRGISQGHGHLQYTVDGACRPPFSKMLFEEAQFCK